MGVGAASTPWPWCSHASSHGACILCGSRGRISGRCIIVSTIAFDDLTSRGLNGDSLAFTRPIFPWPGSARWLGLSLGFTLLLSHASFPGACEGQESV